MFILGKYPYANPARLQLKSPACIQSVTHDGNIASYRSRKNSRLKTCGDLWCLSKCLYFQITDHHWREHTIINKLATTAGKAGYPPLPSLYKMYTIYASVSAWGNHKTVPHWNTSKTSLTLRNERISFFPKQLLLKKAVFTGKDFQFRLLLM